MRTAIQPTRKEDYPEWYQAVLQAADLSEHAAVRGCMIIKPWGYALWENIQRILDGKFKATGHQNAYFPLFIPLSYFEKEADHVEGFAKECAVVTHHRLEKGVGGKLVPASPLEEPLVVRPTSEMVIGHAFAKWIQSYRDLPILMNQWANVVRWEMRTRMFLRTTEFLWQEGHTAHATQQEAEAETKKMLELYCDFCRDYLAIPVIAGEKTESEKFPGAVATYTIEAMMQDGKALQSGTSHFLGQNFAKSCDIQFSTQEGTRDFAWTTSWGMTTRLIGGLIMVHSDDDGLVLPPRIASAHLVILPIVHQEETKASVLEYCETLAKELRTTLFDGRPLEVTVDRRDLRGGEKSWSWIKKGVPLRVEIGAKEMQEGRLGIAQRDKLHKEKVWFAQPDLAKGVVHLLDAMQDRLLQKAIAFRNNRSVRLDTRKDFIDFFQSEGGFAYCHWNGSAQVEKEIKEELNVTIRCIPIDSTFEKGKCIWTGEPSERRVLFAKSY